MDTEKVCKLCEICTQAKGEYQKPAGKLHPLQIATRPWELIGMDFIGPFPEVNGYNYLWVVICRMTSVVHLVPVNMKTTASQLSTIYILLEIFLSPLGHAHSLDICTVIDAYTPD